MSALHPRTTDLVGLPNRSNRKPDPLGTGFKPTACPIAQSMAASYNWKYKGVRKKLMKCNLTMRLAQQLVRFFPC